MEIGYNFGNGRLDQDRTPSSLEKNIAPSFPDPQSFHLPKYLLIKMLSIAIGRREHPLGTANAAGAILPPDKKSPASV